MAKPLAYNATLVARTDLTDALAIFRIQPDEAPAERPWFESGQYCVLGLNNPDPALGSVRRSMSIASAPEDDGATEFYIRFVAQPASDNPFTHLLWRLRAGDRLYMRPVAAGVFTLSHTLRPDDARLRLLVAAGTGSAPFVSMVRSALRRDPRADLSRFALLHGVSYPADLGYRDELSALAASHGLRYLPTVSRPPADGSWAGDVGRVEGFFAPARLPGLEARLGLAPGELTPARAVVYICGLTGTIGGTVANLVDRGFVAHHRRLREALGVPAEVPESVFFEQYDTEPVIDLKDPAVIEPLRARMQAALGRA